MKRVAVMNIKSTDWKSDCEALINIRDQVFIQEQRVSRADELDDKDETAIHFLVENDQGKAVACARVLQEDNLFHIGRVAVLTEYRHQQIGRRLMQFILRWCNQQNSEYKIYLHAQTTRVLFYEHLGFVTKGNIFMDAGIEHIEMWFNQ
jgi:predicted GNAT family N-acyltransferase